jgi:hypothetical protein
VFAVGAAVVGEQPDRDRLPALQTLNAVRTKMHVGSVARDRDVAGKFVDLAAECERLTAPGLRPRAIGGSFDQQLDRIALIHEGLENGRAGSGALCGRIRWMEGHASGEAIGNKSHAPP